MLSSSIESGPRLHGARRRRSFGWKTAVVAVAVILVAWMAERVSDLTHDNVSDVQKLARSLQIIHTSSAANPKTLKVLFYGQSITRSGWHEDVVEHWHKEYPNTIFVVENRALGGFAAQALVRAT